MILTSCPHCTENIKAELETTSFKGEGDIRLEIRLRCRCGRFNEKEMISHIVSNESKAFPTEKKEPPLVAQFMKEVLETFELYERNLPAIQGFKPTIKTLKDKFLSPYYDVY